MKSRLRLPILLGASFLALQALAGSFSSLVAGTKTSTGTGSWNTSGTWSPSGVPGAGDSVVIAAGHIVTLNTNGTCGVLNVLGTLNYDVTASRSLTVTTSSGMTGNVRISGTFDMGNASSQTASIAGSFTNNGTFTAGTSSITFTGATSTIVSGSSTTNFSSITINKGSSSASVLDVQSVITMASDGLTLVNGTFKLSSNSTITPFTVDITTAPYLIPSTAGLWINGGTVTTTDNMTCAGLLRVSNGTFNLGNGIDERFRSTGTIGATVIIEGGAWNIAARFSRDNIGDGVIFTMSGGTLTLNTIGSSDLTHAAFHVDASGSSFTMSGGTIAIRRTNGSNLGYTNLAGTTNVTGGTLQIGDASTPASQTFLINSSAPIWNLTVNGANSPTAQLSTNSPLAVKNNVTLTSGSLNANNLALIVGGNWTNNVSAGAFTPGSGTVTLSGSSTQSIGGLYSTTFNNLMINNAAGITLGANVTVNGTLTLTSGNIATSSWVVSIVSTGSVSRTSGHIVGNLRKAFAPSAKTNTFEIGTGNDYTPVSLAFGTVTASGNLTATTIVGDHTNIGSAAIDPAKSVNRTWTLTNSGITFDSYSATFTFVASDVDAGANTANFIVGKYSGSWTYPTVGTKTAAVTEITGVTSFSDFQIGEPSVVPIQLASFTGHIAVGAQEIVLEWTTLTETNNYGFYIQRRASNEQNFAELPNSFVPGHGTTLQPHTYWYIDATVIAGQWWYRLKQIDLDGTVHYSDPVQIEVLTDVKEHSLPTNFSLEQNFPEPFNPSTTIPFGLPVDVNVSLEVFNVLGSRVAELASGRMGAGNHSVVFDASKLPSGMYLYRLIAGSFVQTKKLLLLR